MNNFNFLAPFYDSLVHIVFGPALYNASTHFLAEIPPDSRVLVLGGGTGKMLSKLKKCDVVYVEKSAQMLRRAKKRNELGRISFVNEDFLKWQTDQNFEVVICPFFLDVFTEANLKLVLNRIGDLADKGSQLIVADFQDTGRFEHRMLLKLMHWFFRIATRLEGRKLARIEHFILQEHYEVKARSTFRNGFVFSAVYQKV